MKNCSRFIEKLIKVFPSQYELKEQQVYESGMPFCPDSPEELAQLLTFAANNRIPVIPRGNGTRLNELHSADPSLSIGISTKNLNRILSVQRETMTCQVQSGVLMRDLLKVAQSVDMFLPTNGLCLAGRTVGGLISENAAGWEQAAYGTLYSHVLGMEVALPSGDLIEIGGKTRKNVSGLETGCLFAGSCGTLGIIVSLTFRMEPLPGKQSLCLLKGRNLAEVLGALQHFRQNRLLRPTSAHALNNLFHPDSVHLVLSFAGTKQGVDQQLGLVQGVPVNQRPEVFESELDVQRIWQVIRQRQDVLWNKAPGVKFHFDRGRLPELPDLFGACRVEDYILDLETGEGLAAGVDLVQIKLAESRVKDERLFSIKSAGCSAVFQRIKQAVDRNNIMFPNCGILRS